MSQNSKKNKTEMDNKARMLYIFRYLYDHTDEDHPTNTNELIEYIEKDYGVTVNRTTIGDDIDSLTEAGFLIESIRSRPNKYYYGGRTFEVPELKMLIDAVSSSKFITEKSSKTLIDKILTLASEHDRDRLQRNIMVEGRVKSDNEKGYYIVDTVNGAIEGRQVISFQYSDYTVDKEKIARHQGEEYYVSPYALVWDGDYYYLIGWCKNRDEMRHFRLDRIMRAPKICEDIAWTVPPENFQLTDYIRHVFRMYGSDETMDIELLCHESTMKAVIDQFGVDVETSKINDWSFKAHVNVCPSPTFYRWVFSWGRKMTILSPPEAVEEYKDMLGRALDALEKGNII